MPSNIPSKSDENGAAEFIKYQKLCDLDYYSRFSREELETKHADILHLYEIIKKDTRVWIALSFALIPVSALILWDFYLLLTNPAYAFYTSKNMNIAEIIILLIFEQRFSFAASRPSSADPILHFFIIFRNTYIPLPIPFFGAKKKAPAMRKVITGTFNVSFIDFLSLRYHCLYSTR